MEFMGKQIDTSKMSEAQIQELKEYIDLITPAPVATPIPASELPTVELEAELKELVARKSWSSRYFEVDREVQNRATRRWVHDDVFGNTFAPLTGTHD